MVRSCWDDPVCDGEAHDGVHARDYDREHDVHARDYVRDHDEHARGDVRDDDDWDCYTFDDAGNCASDRQQVQDFQQW